MLILYCMKKHKGFVATNKKMVAVLGVFGFMIIGLVVGILVLNNPFWGNGENEVITDNNAGEVAFNLSEEISEKLADESDYGLEQAVSEYEEAYNTSEGRTKVYIAIEYANFVYDYYADLDRAVNILKGVEEGIDERDEGALYLAFSNLYEKSGDNETAEYYEDIFKDKIKEMEKKYGGE